MNIEHANPISLKLCIINTLLYTAVYINFGLWGENKWVTNRAMTDQLGIIKWIVAKYSYVLFSGIKQMFIFCGPIKSKWRWKLAKFTQPHHNNSDTCKNNVNCVGSVWSVIFT